MATIFSKIVSGDIPCHKVAEDEHFLAFLDIMPLTRGHVLVIPKNEVDYLFDMEDDILGELLIFAKKVARKMKIVLPCRRIGLTVIGLEVPHAHIHLIPINGVSDMDFSKPKLQPSQSELSELAKMISEA